MASPSRHHVRRVGATTPDPFAGLVAARCLPARVRGCSRWATAEFVESTYALQADTHDDPAVDREPTLATRRGDRKGRGTPAALDGRQPQSARPPVPHSRWHADLRRDPGRANRGRLGFPSRRRPRFQRDGSAAAGHLRANALDPPGDRRNLASCRRRAIDGHPVAWFSRRRPGILLLGCRAYRRVVALVLRLGAPPAGSVAITESTVTCNREAARSAAAPGIRTIESGRSIRRRDNLGEELFAQALEGKLKTGG